MLAILDGVLMDADQARIPVTDEGLLRGDGVFEVVRLYDGRPFALDEHLDRMARSAAAVRLALDLEAVRDDIGAILAEAAPADGALRVLVTRGGRRIALVEPLKELPDTIALATITYAPSRILNGVKSLSYAANMLASRVAREAGADEALLVTPHGRVLEAPTTSFVYVLGGRLYTPPLADGILDSITRRILFAVTEIEERVTTLDDLRALDEAFLASSIREVHPVHAIDGAPIEGAPGPVTADVAERVREHIAGTLARRP
jgi:branched-chain amino acid aminotransferase